MNLRNRRHIVALALGTTLLATIGSHQAAAKKRKTKASVAATINGQHRKWKSRNITVDVRGENLTVVATILRPRLNQFVPGLAVSCQLDFAGPFPVTPVFPQICVVGYTEFKAKVPIVTKMWGGSNADGVVVTFDGFDGTRLTGTVHGTLQSQDTPPNPPLTIDNGTFSVKISR